MTQSLSNYDEAQDVVAEAARLLQDLVLEMTDGGDIQKGELVLVSISSERLNGHLRALITCYAYGHRLVDWTTLRIGLKRKDRQDCFWLLPLLNRRGQTSIQNLEPGSYSVVSIRTKQRVPLQTPALAAQGKWVRTRGKTHSAVRTRGPAKQRDALTVLLSPLDENRIRVEFETTSPRFADQQVEFALLAQDTGSVVVEERVILAQVGETRWLGAWEGKVDPHKAFLVRTGVAHLLRGL